MTQEVPFTVCSTIGRATEVSLVSDERNKDIYIHIFSAFYMQKDLSKLR